MNDTELWYEAPANVWTEALPIGNGRLGAMLFGGIALERLQLNEDTLWSGGPYAPINPEARDNLDQVRKLIFAGQFAEAEALANRHLMARPIKQMSFQPAGDLWIEQDVGDEVVSYRRALDLDTAIATTVFRVGDTTFTREAFASAVDGVIVVHFTADRPQSVGFSLALTSEQPGSADLATETQIGWHGHNRDELGIEGRLDFALRAVVRTSGGRVQHDGSTLIIKGADKATILVDAATSFRRFDDTSGDPDARIAARHDAVSRRSYAQLRSAHVEDHQSRFRRLEINLGRTSAADKATDRRIAASQHVEDPALAALYVQFGRYLMLSSSRPGTQAANLQGIWNDQTEPPWGSKYTANINLQMNYWLPDAANLSECMEPLLRLAEEVSITGTTIAQVHYGARGWVLHHNTDLWRAAGPIDGAQWGLWPTGGAWLCAQLWDHAAFLGRPESLVRRLYPLLAGAARFILDVLVPLPGSDFLVTSPSVSPENIHSHGATICAGPAMDSQIVRDLFAGLLAAADQLGINEEIVDEVRRTQSRLPADRIGGAGQLQEWLEDWDLDAPEIHHRHVSHLYGLHPSQQIGLDTTPELAAAARRSLEIRGDDATGWGIGWRINLWARLRDGDHAHDVVRLLLGPERTYPNMFDAHPPFQIDGNFGGAAGILEMLVQSGESWVHLLPALPAAWPSGSLRGVRARGGLEIEMRWADGQLAAASVRSGDTRSAEIRIGDATVTAALSPDRAWVWSPGASGSRTASG